MSISLNNSKVVRSGCYPKLISLPQSKSVRKFEYQDLKNVSCHEISGNLSIRSGYVEPKGTLNYRTKIKLFEFPSSSRILIPDNQPQEKPNVKRENSQRTIRSAHYTPGNINSMISRTDKEDNITKCRRQPNNKVYKSFSFLDILNDSQPTIKRELKEEVLYEKYNNQTQITALPGGVKRNDKEINDNVYNRRSKSSHFAKVMLDYSSSVTCLQGQDGLVKYQEQSKQVEAANVTTNKHSTKTVLQNRYYCNDKPSNENKNQKISYDFLNRANAQKGLAQDQPVKPKHIITYQRTYGECQNEKKLINHGKSKRPEFIKNPFASQIQIM